MHVTNNKYIPLKNNTANKLSARPTLLHVLTENVREDILSCSDFCSFFNSEDFIWHSSIRFLFDSVRLSRIKL